MRSGGQAGGRRRQPEQDALPRRRQPRSAAAAECRAPVHLGTARRRQTPRSAELAERVDRSLRNAEELLDGLLDISRLDAGALRPELRTSSRSTKCCAASSNSSPRWPKPADLVAASCADRAGRRKRPPHAASHPAEFRVERAALHPSRRRADRHARRSGAAVRIEVWDSGPGIAPQHLDTIFREFARLDHDSPWGERGLGLGLSICERIARMLGHPLTVRSRVGRGSMFAVSLPRAHADSINAAAPSPRRSPTTSPACTCSASTTTTTSSTACAPC
jgi:signal transduction histidine kinase